jgi:hypothetical protein
MQRRSSPKHSSIQSKSRTDIIDGIPKKSIDHGSKAHLPTFKFQDKDGDKENTKCNSPFTQYSPSSHGSKVQFLLSIFDQPGLAVRKRPFNSVGSASIIAKQCHDPVEPNAQKQARLEKLMIDHSISTPERSVASKLEDIGVNGTKSVTVQQPEQKETRLTAEIGVMSQSRNATPISANHVGNQFLPVQDTTTQIEMERRLLNVSDTLDSFLIMEQISLGDENMKKARPFEETSSDCTSSEASPNTLNMQEDADSTMYLSASIMVFSSPGELQDRNLFRTGDAASKISAGLQVSIPGFNMLTCHDARNEQINSSPVKSSAGELSGELKASDILGENLSALSERITMDDLKNIEISVHPVDKGSLTLRQQYGLREVDGNAFEHPTNRGTVDAESIFPVQRNDCVADKSSLCELKVRLAVAEQLLHEDTVSRELAQNALMSQFTALLTEISHLTGPEKTTALCIDKKEQGDHISSADEHKTEERSNVVLSTSGLGFASTAEPTDPTDDQAESLAHAHSTLESLRSEISGLRSSKNRSKESHRTSHVCFKDGPDGANTDSNAIRQHDHSVQAKQLESEVALSIANLSIFCDSGHARDVSLGVRVESSSDSAVPAVASISSKLPEQHTLQRGVPRQAGIRGTHHDTLQASQDPRDAHPNFRYSANQNQATDSQYGYADSSSQPARPSSSRLLDQILWPERQEPTDGRFPNRLASASSGSIGRDSGAVGRPTLTYSEYFQHMRVASMGPHMFYPVAAPQLGAAPALYSASAGPAASRLHACENYERTDAESRTVPEMAAAPCWYSSQQSFDQRSMQTFDQRSMQSFDQRSMQSIDQRSMQSFDQRSVAPQRSATVRITSTCAMDMQCAQPMLERPALRAVPFQAAETAYTYSQGPLPVYASAPHTSWAFGGPAVTTAAGPAMVVGMGAHLQQGGQAFRSHPHPVLAMPMEAAAVHSGPFQAGTPGRIVRADVMVPQNRADAVQLWGVRFASDGGGAQDPAHGSVRTVWVPC